jgi:perosamine synthetase
VRSGSRFRHVAPAGAPIRISDVARWAGALLRRADPLDDLRRSVRQQLGIEHCFLTCTGRAGLSIALQGLADLSRPDRDEVILPSYTCFSVAASVVKAGLKVRLVDVDPQTLDFDLDALARADYRRVLAVVATNLYGLPSAMPEITAIAQRHGAFVVDDAAQAFGATVGGAPSGTWGDVGLLSFDKGKNVSAIDGGALVTRSSAVADAIERRVRSLAVPGPGHIVRDVVKLGVYVALLPPSVYWIPNAIPQLGLGTTVYTTDFAVEGYNRWLAAMAHVMLPRLTAFTAARQHNASELACSLSGIPGLGLPASRPDTNAVFVRFPVLVSDPAIRARLLAALNEGGIGATSSYPSALVDVPGLQAHLVDGRTPVPGGRFVASAVVTLPTHPYVAPADRARTVGIVRRVLDRATVDAIPLAQECHQR